jgi:nicotinate phosphoribosyltransferase
VRRFFDGHFYIGDAIYDEIIGIHEPCTIINQSDPNSQLTPTSHSFDLLVPIFRKGKLVYSSPSIQAMQAHAKQELSRLSPSMERFTNPEPYLAGLEKNLYQKKLEMIRKLRR